MNISNFGIESVEFSQTFFRPGEPAHWTVLVRNDDSTSLPVNLIARISYLARTLVELKNALKLSAAINQVEFTWFPPSETPRGYGLDLVLIASDGQTLATYSTAFDVLEHWTQMPRYGFLSDFSPNRQDVEAVMQSVMKYRLNALQFYDWMYRHDQFLTEQEPYIDPLGRKLSRQTVNALIAAAHGKGIAAMPYTAVYAASMEFYHQHPDWALYRFDGHPYFFGENFLVIMDPRPGSPWSEHLLAQFEDVLTHTAFDGIHLDQYGDPKVGYDIDGRSFDLAEPLAEMINATQERVRKLRPDGTVVFNAVTNWPIETVASARQDIVYIEVWPPYTSFTALYALVVQAQQFSGGKAVVLAAYIDPAHEVNARLLDAIILASGGTHIEFGEEEGYLSDPYFPNYKILSPYLGKILRGYQEFAIRYQNVFGPSTKETTSNYSYRISMPGVETSPSLQWNKVHPLVREGDSYTAFNFINMVGLSSGEWNEPLSQSPATLTDQTVVISDLTRSVKQVWWASPDGQSISLSPLPHREEGSQLVLQIPLLQYWSMILIEWSD